MQSKLSEISKKEYIKVANRLLSLTDEALTTYLNKSKSRSSHFKSVAALQYYEKHIMAHSEHGKIQQVKELLRVKPTYKKRQSKSSVELKDGWRDVLIKTVIESKTIHKEEIFVAILTGLRPSELENVVRVTVDNDQVKFMIYGTKLKVSENGNIEQGMVWRSIAYPLSSKDNALTFLLEILKEQNPVGNAYEVGLKTSTHGFSSALSKLGDGLIKTRGKSFSPLNLRNAFATLLKSSDCNDVDISRALGQISMKSKSYCGRTKMSPTGISPCNITSSHTPRPYSRNHPATTLP